MLGLKHMELYSASGSDIELDSYWMPHANELGSASTAPSINLNFGSEIDTYNLTDYGNNNSVKTMKITLQMYIVKKHDYINLAVLPLKILLQLTLDDKIIIGTRLYKITNDY